MAKDREERMAKKKNLTFFLLIIPTFLMALTASIEEIFVRIGIQAVLFILQIVLVKNLLDDYYGD